MASIPDGDVNSSGKLRMPAAAATVQGAQAGAQLLQVVHLLHQLGLPPYRSAGRSRPRSCTPLQK